MARTSQHDNAKSSVPFNVAVAKKGSPFYGNCQPTPKGKIWLRKRVAVLGAAN